MELVFDRLVLAISHDLASMFGKQILTLLVASVFLIGGLWGCFRTKSLQDFLYRESVSGAAAHGWPRNLNSINSGWNYYLIKIFSVLFLVAAVLILWVVFFKTHS